MKRWADIGGRWTETLPRFAPLQRQRFHEIAPKYVAWYCPGCKETHAVPVAGHSSGRGWEWNGSLEYPTLNPSILCNVGGANHMQPICHTYIRDGKIQFLGDCTHELAGKIVDIPEWE